jgi:ABC-2 type transport system permease protein
MNSITTIWKREVKGYFYTPLAYIFVGIFSILVGLMMKSFLSLYDQFTKGAMFGAQQEITIDKLAEAFYLNVHLFLVFIIPFFTMRLITEETRNNTLALLLTSPIKTWEITWAKFFSGVTMLLALLTVTVIFPIFLVAFSEPGQGAGPDLGVILSTYLGLILVGSAYIAIGLFWSSMTSSQMIAVLFTFATNLAFFWLLALAAQASSGTSQEVFKYLATSEQLQTFTKGIFELKSFVYFLSLITFFLFLTKQSIESRAWRS